VRMLTIDWDFFFPDTAPFDWGHDESRGFFLEQIWWMRPGQRDVLGKLGTALDVVKPDPLHEGFCLGLARPSYLVVAESHADAFHALQSMGARRAEVWNLDAHHDLGYGEDEGRDDPDPGKVDCGNWAAMAIRAGMVSSYNLVYPAWRAKSPERESPADLRGKARGARLAVRRSMDGVPARFDAIFLCRSGCWTPTWHDDAWLGLVGGARALGAGREVILPYALKARRPDEGEAAKAARDWEDVVRRTRTMTMGVIPSSALGG